MIAASSPALARGDNGSWAKRYERLRILGLELGAQGLGQGAGGPAEAQGGQLPATARAGHGQPCGEGGQQQPEQGHQPGRAQLTPHGGVHAEAIEEHVARARQSSV